MKQDTPSTQSNPYLALFRKFNIKKLLLILAYFFLLFCLLPLEYDDIKVRTFVKPLIYASAAFLLYRAVTAKSRDKYAKWLLGGLLTFFFLIYLFFKLIGFCAWGDFGIQYVNRNDNSDRIIMRGYGCFLTDDDTQLFEERLLTKHLKWVTNFDEQPIDKNKWQETFK